MAPFNLAHLVCPRTLKHTLTSDIISDKTQTSALGLPDNNNFINVIQNYGMLNTTSACNITACNSDSVHIGSSLC